MLILVNGTSLGRIERQFLGQSGQFEKERRRQLYAKIRTLSVVNSNGGFEIARGLDIISESEKVDILDAVVSCCDSGRYAA